jgi:hypothetical protein
MSNFHFDLSLTLSQGQVHDFSGEVQKFLVEVQNDLRGGAHLHTPPLKIRRHALWYRYFAFSLVVEYNQKHTLTHKVQHTVQIFDKPFKKRQWVISENIYAGTEISGS